MLCCFILGHSHVVIIQGGIALSLSRSSQHCTPVEYVLYPIPPVVSSSAGPGGSGWVRLIMKARSLADTSSPWMREMWSLGMSSFVLYIGISSTVIWTGEGEGEEGEGEGEGKMEGGGQGSHGVGWQRLSGVHFLCNLRLGLGGWVLV